MPCLFGDASDSCLFNNSSCDGARQWPQNFNRMFKVISHMYDNSIFRRVAMFVPVDLVAFFFSRVCQRHTVYL